MKKYNLAFIGFGVVGQGLADLLGEKRGLLKERYGFEYEVVVISDSLKGSVYNSDSAIRDVQSQPGSGGAGRRRNQE